MTKAERLQMKLMLVHGRTRSGHPRLSLGDAFSDVDARDKRGHDD
jgi:hypothetical protein